MLLNITGKNPAKKENENNKGNILARVKKYFGEGMFATSSVWRLEQTKDERRKRNNQQIGTEMPGMFNVEQIQHGDRKKYNAQC